uniref:Disease resistance protein RGA3 n=1 Tax=Populus trichocarpa TaxID=3694 RepID=A0A2K1XNJ9_POPTR
MAAELFLTFAMEETLTRVSSIAAEGIGLAWGLEGQLLKLEESLTMIQAVLQDAARRPVTDKSAKLWLEKLQDVAYNAEDVLDEFAYEILRKDQKKGKVRGCFSLHNPVAFRLNMGQKVKEINGSLDEIQKLATRFGLGIASQHVESAPEVFRDIDRETDSLLESSEVVVGREDDVYKVMKLLIGSIGQQVLSVVPIVGMAGLGKTTIAKKICQLAREKKHFDVTLWVCVSNDFSKRRILGEMLQKIDKSTGGLSNLDAILEKLQQELENKTLLLVLDDVWNEDYDKWAGLKEGLLKINSRNGNAVVITTRSKKVADMMETSPGIQHEPGRLSADQCWSIINQKSLRTLKLRGANITELPDSICKLRYLRYLDVSDTAIRALPESITKLYHLETLRLTDCKSLEKLPKKMRNLVSLRHLHFDDPKLVPAEVRLLTRLQTLPFFGVGPDHMVEELGCLKELRGALKICKLEQVRDREEAEKAELSGKRMNKLVFEWSDDEGTSSVNSEDVLEGLQPHPDIRSLTIEGYGGENFSSWILQLNNLTVLRLKGCSKNRQLPTLGCLPRLKILEIGRMPNVKCIGNEFYSSSSGSEAVLFPALKELTLMYMDGLEEWMVPGGEGDQVFPCLERLSIWMCGKLKSIPICGLSSLVKFDIGFCAELRYFSGEFRGFTSLQILEIRWCSKLASIPSIQHCTALVQLMIGHCRELMSIPGDFRELKYSLKELMVDGCKLGALPSGLQCCASLERLVINDWSELIHISDLQELSSLRSLTIKSCDKLISIDWHGLRQLPSLVHLTIRRCRSLSDIPEDDWLAGLTQLKELIIGGYSEEMEVSWGLNYSVTL